MNWIDISLLIILLIFIIIGFCKGFVFSIISMFSTFVNFMISIFLTKPISILFNSCFNLEYTLTDQFANKLSNLHEGFSTNLVNMSNSEISNHISSTLNSSNFPFKNLFEKLINIDSNLISNKESLTLTDILSKSLGSFFTLIISFVTVFVLIYIILLIVSKLSKKAKEITGIRVIDRILGVIFGIIKGSIIISLIFVFISFFKEDGLLSPLFDYIKQSELSKWIYQNVNLFVDKYITLDNIKNLIT